MAENGTCIIRLSRPSRFADTLRSYKILMDGREAGSIGNGGILELRAPAGVITIEARIDWGRSAPLTIDAAPNQTIDIEVSNRWGALLSIWAITFGKNSYLKLERKAAH